MHYLNDISDHPMSALFESFRCTETNHDLIAYQTQHYHLYLFTFNQNNYDF